MASFATSINVESRLGRSLTAAETAIANFVIETVSGLIVEAVNKTDAWAEALTAIPVAFRTMCVEKAVSTIVNPNNLANVQESLGAFTHSETYPRSQDVGVFLSADERSRVRRALHGTNLIDVRTPTAAEVYLEDALGS